MGDIFILLLTLAVGFAAGSYIYFIGFREIDIDPVNPRSINQFEIAVSTYGGCQVLGQCRAYRLLPSGEYVSVVGEESVTGTLDEDDLTALKQALVEADLTAMATVTEPEFCESWVDGIDIEYDITLEGASYQLDTCGTTVDVDDELIETLDELLARFSDDL